MFADVGLKHALKFYLEQTCATSGPRAALRPARLFRAARVVLSKMLEVYTSHHSLMQFTSKQGKFSRAVYNNIALCDVRMLRCNNFAMQD